MAENVQNYLPRFVQKYLPYTPSFGKYLTEKYRHENLPEDGNYIIVSKEDVSHRLARRLSLKVVLQRTLRIDHIREVAIGIMREYQSVYDVIWLYMAKSSDDLIFSNWVLQGQWISQNLKPRSRPMKIGTLDNHGYSWIHTDSYETLSNYFADYAFEEDKVLYVSYF